MVRKDTESELKHLSHNNTRNETNLLVCTTKTKTLAEELWLHIKSAIHKTTQVLFHLRCTEKNPFTIRTLHKYQAIIVILLSLWSFQDQGSRLYNQEKLAGAILYWLTIVMHASYSIWTQSTQSNFHFWSWQREFCIYTGRIPWQDCFFIACNKRSCQNISGLSIGTDSSARTQT